MHKNIQYFFRQSWLLIVASFAFGLLLAVTDQAWSPRIAKNMSDKFTQEARMLLPAADTIVEGAKNAPLIFADGSTENVDIKKGVDANGNAVGWVFRCTGNGYADKIELIVAVNADFTELMGYEILFSNETPGYGDHIKDPYFKQQFIGAPAKNLTLEKTGDAKKVDDTIVAITGATVTSRAIVNIFNTYIEPVHSYLKLKGFVK